VIFFVLSPKGQILSANQYANQFIGYDPVGQSFHDVIVDFSENFDLNTCVSDPSTERMITIAAGSGAPETFYFTFEKIKDRVLAFGRMDTDEIEIMRNEVLTLNREQNDLVRKLHKTNAQLTQKEEALTKSITDLELAQSKLIESEKMASLGRMVAGFAHEINTPIGIALTASSSVSEFSRQIDHMLTQDEVDEEDLVSALESIRDASKLVYSNLKRSVDLVGSFKRTSVDQSIENLSEYCLNENIEDALTSMRVKIKDPSIKIIFEYHENINIYGNPGDIFQIISNLVENSLLHGFENGKLKGDILIRVEKKEKNILIFYSDTGQGMSIETADRIFEPFFTTLRARGGTGLGMYICHNLVTNNLNGTIQCDSRLGEGTNFLIDIPIIEQEIDETHKIQE